MAGNIVNRSINIFVESGEAEAAYNRLLDKEKKLKTELDKATDPKQIQKLKTELDKLSEPLDRASKKATGQLQPSIRELEATFNKLRNQVRNFDGDQKGLDNLILKLQKAKVELLEAKNRAEGLGKSVNNGNFLTRAASGLKNFGGGVLEGLGGDLLPVAGIAGAGIFLKQALDEVIAVDERVARFQVTLRNLGKEDAFDRLAKSADQLANNLQFFGGDDLYPVFEKLLDYGKLTENQIKQLTPLIVDYAAKQKVTFEQASDEIIKGLNGQDKGLKQFGISLKDAGTTTERFNIIVGELGPKLKGSAEAFGESTQGNIKKTGEQFDTLKETIGRKLLPVINTLLKGVDFFLIGLNDVVDKIGDGFNFIFNRAKFLQDQLESLNEQRRKSALETADAIAELYSKESDQQIEDRLKRSQQGLANAQKQLNKAITDEEKAYYQQRVADETAITESIQAELSDRKKVREQEYKEKEDERKKALEEEKKKQAQAAAEFSKLMDELAAKALELQFYGAPQLIKDLNRVNQYYDALEKRAQGNAKVLQQIEDLRNRENFLLVDAYQKAEEEKRKKLTEEEAKKQKALDDKRLKEQLDFADKLAQELAKRAQAELGDKQAGLELDALKKRGKARLNAELEILKLQEQQELANTNLTENQRLLIEEKYREKRNELEKQYTLGRISSVLDYANQAIVGISTVFDAISQRENQELERDRQINEKKKSNLEARLKKGLISQQVYNQEVAKLDAQQEKKEREIRLKQFKRDKALKIATTIMNTAQAIVSALSAPWPSSIVFAALAGAVGAAQLAIIASQKAPEFAKGGYLPGPSHKDGGMPVINPRTGQKVAEVEGGEVILSKATVRNNRNLVAQLLDASMNRGGSRISPSWANEPYQGLNVNSIHRSQQRVRMFETGGVFSGASDTPDMSGTLNMLTNSVNNLVNVLDGGILSYMVLSSQEAAQSRKANILKDATIK